MLYGILAMYLIIVAFCLKNCIGLFHHFITVSNQAAKLWIFSLLVMPGSEIFRSYKYVISVNEWLRIQTYTRHSWPFSSEGSLTCHTYYNTGSPILYHWLRLVHSALWLAEPAPRFNTFQTLRLKVIKSELMAAILNLLIETCKTNNHKNGYDDCS